MHQSFDDSDQHPDAPEYDALMPPAPAKGERTRKWHSQDAAFLIDHPWGRRVAVVQVITEHTAPGHPEDEKLSTYEVMLVTPVLDHGADKGRDSFHDWHAGTSKQVRSAGERMRVSYYMLEKPEWDREDAI